MRILFFGQLREVAGTGELTADLPGDVRDVEALRDWLGSTNVALRGRLDEASVKVAVNGEVAPGNSAIAAGDEIAFMPPMSGG